MAVAVHAEEEEEAYGEHTAPDAWTLYKVFTRKTFLVSWTRWRLQQSLVWPTVHALLHLAFWLFFKWLLEQELETHDPNMPQVDEVMLVIFRTLTPIMLAISMKTVLGKFVLEIVGEKESRMMIAQHVAGLPPRVYWLSYLTYFAATSLVPALAWTAVLLPTGFKGCGFLAVFLTIFLGFQHMFLWAVLLQTFFERARTASALTSATLLIPLLPIGFGYAGLGDPAYIDALVAALGFLPNFALSFWCQAVLSTAWYHPWGFNADFFHPADLPFWAGDFAVGAERLPSAGRIWLVFLAHLALCALFTYWFNQVWQGELGTARPPCFCLRRRRVGAGAPAEAPGGESGGAAPALELSHVSKTFRGRGGPHTAVDDVSLTVQPRELFALLGHNGSGKTTIINMISGMLPLTSGEVRVMGASCAEDIVRCRQSMALCPQDNPMYESISVDEHLRFFAELRGVQNQDFHVARVLEALGLSEKRRARCGTLSGGQKRRLWVATSLLGRAALVFLDEPTSGMDPSSRRELWALLLGMRGRGRSCLFTTHYLEEADLLADRKAVIARGRLRGLGTSKELKAQFGAGYHLRVMTPRSAPAGALEELTRVVAGGVAGAAREEVPRVERAQAADAPVEVRYTLPAGGVDSFGELFLAIEGRREELRVLDFELAATSLEEVFMRLGQEGGDGAAEDPDFQVLDQEKERTGRALSAAEHARLLFGLRTTQTLANKKVLLGTVLFPALFTFFALLHTSYFLSRHKMMQAIFAMYPGVIAAIAGMRLPYTLIEERERKIAQVMISMGMPRRVYWLTTLGHNALQVLLVTVCSPLVLAIGGETCLDRGRWFPALLAALLHAVPLSLFFFVVSSACRTAENASKTLNLLNVIFGLLTNVLPSLLWNFEQDEMPDAIASAVHTASSFLSPYYLLPGVLVGVWQAGGGDAYKCSYVTDRSHPYASECFRVPETAGLADFMGTWVFWAPWVGQLFLCAVLSLIAYRLTSPGGRREALGELPPEPPAADADVQAEAARVRDAPPEKEACLYRGLRHVYRGAGACGPVHAVRGISLGVRPGECLGLLGPNGAGKTTTLGCLTGEIRPSAGEVYVAGRSVHGPGAGEALRHLGFCPQVDPLFGDLSGRQHLLYYGALKGLEGEGLAEAAEGLLARLGLGARDAGKPAQTYSGGMRRKLSLAIALIGPSSVLFLDEPSAAVDAGAKRLLWRAIKMRASSRSVVITTHSMEEAEAVCDRIGIQVLGSLRCLGTPIHLKARYGSGYQMELRFRQGEAPDPGDGRRLPASEAEVTDFVQRSLSPEARLLEAQDARYLYQLPRFRPGGLSLGQVFQGLRRAGETHALEEYSLVQPSLEQVFLRFAREQQEGRALGAAADAGRDVEPGLPVEDA